MIAITDDGTLPFSVGMGVKKRRLRELYSFRKWEHADQNVNKWKLDRLPTRGERVLGILAGFGAVLLSGLLSAAGVLQLFKAGITFGNIIFLIVFLVLTGISVYILYRAVFSEPKKPDKRIILIVSVSVLVLGAFLIAVAVFAEKIELGRRFFMLATGFAAIGASVPMIKKSLEENM